MIGLFAYRLLSLLEGFHLSLVRMQFFFSCSILKCSVANTGLVTVKTVYISLAHFLLGDRWGFVYLKESFISGFL